MNTLTTVFAFLSLASAAGLSAQKFLSESVVERLSPSSQDMMRLPVNEDLAVLGLRVIGVEVVESLKDFQNKLEPKGGAVLVVVSLGGELTANDATRFDVGAADFSAFCTKSFEGGLTQSLIVPSSAIYSKNWTFHGSTATFTLDPGPVTLRVAFVVPEEVKSFVIRFPTKLGGAEVPLAAPSPPSAEDQTSQQGRVDGS